MIRHETLNPPPHIYPVNDWKIIEASYFPQFLAQTETLFSVGNGYLGMRGNFEEGLPVCQNGTFINRFHETWPIVYGEDAYGFAKTGQTILNVTDCKTVRLYVDDEPFHLPSATMLLYERALDMRAGTLDREILWETPAGKQVMIETQRMVSLQNRHLALVSYQVTVLNDDAPVVISSEMHGNPSQLAANDDPRLAKGFSGKVMEPRVQWARDQRVLLAHQTVNSRMSLACGMDHRLKTDCDYQVDVRCGEDEGRVVYSVKAQKGKPIHLVKFIAYHTSRSADGEELCNRSSRTLDRAMGDGLPELLKGQKAFLDDFWARSDVEIEADPTVSRWVEGEMQQALRWNLFQILQACARAESAGIPAKGLTGQAYEGHYFWDTEIYVLPFLTYTTPRIARNLLTTRYRMLEKARARAKAVNQVGALFPWRTINGEEASAYYAAGTAQYHINADIMYALKKYVEVTGDQAFLYNEGAEMLVETARLWHDLGFYSERQLGQFCIHGVTGPDEYTTVVNNNTYTNLMARENLWYAAKTVREMRAQHPEHYATLAHKTGVVMDEVMAWQQAADEMYIPYDEVTGIHPQDDNFLDREVWDLKNTPRDRFPLLLYHHPLVIYRHQVIKQADVVLALFLLGNEFTLDEKRRNFSYYDPLTTGDSSLSACIQSIVASETGDMANAVKYARYALLMDLADIGGNVKDGCHIACMGGTWMTVVYGFGGMRDYGGQLSFQPRLPDQLRRLAFHLDVQGQSLRVELTRSEAIYTLRSGAGLTIHHLGEAVALKKGDSVSRAME